MSASFSKATLYVAAACGSASTGSVMAKAEPMVMLLALPLYGVPMVYSAV